MNEDDQAGDQTLTCSDCGTPFMWTVGEQAFFREKNFTAPRRCRPCRVAKRQQKETV